MKQTFICSLHFESKHFKGKRLDLKTAVPISPEIPDHDYGTNKETIESVNLKNEQLKSEVVELKKQNANLESLNAKLISRNTKLTQQTYYLKRKSDSLQNNLSDLKQKLSELQKQFDLSSRIVDDLNKCASEVPLHLFESTAKHARGKRDKIYHPAIRKFALSLHLCSAKAYRLHLYTYSYIQ